MYVPAHLSARYAEQLFEINGKAAFVNIGFHRPRIAPLPFKTGTPGQLLKEDLIFGRGLHVGPGKGKCLKNCHINAHFQFLRSGRLQGVVGNGLPAQAAVDQLVGLIPLLIGGAHASCTHCCPEFQFLEDFQVDVLAHTVGGTDAVKGGPVHTFTK